MVVLLLHLAEAREDAVHVVGLRGIGHRVLQRLELVMQVAEASAAGDRLVEHRAAGHLLDVLPEIADGHPSGHRHLALVRRLLADDHPEQRRLAGAVGTDQADFLAGIELKRRVDEENLPAVLLADAGEGNHEQSYLMCMSHRLPSLAALVVSIGLITHVDAAQSMRALQPLDDRGRVTYFIADGLPGIPISGVRPGPGDVGAEVVGDQLSAAH